MQPSFGVEDAFVDLLHMCLVLIARHILSNQIGPFECSVCGQNDVCIFCIRKDQIYLAGFVSIKLF